MSKYSINSNSMKFTKISFSGIIVLFFFLLTNSAFPADIETSSQDTWEDAEWTFVVGGAPAPVPGPGDNVFLRTEAEITIENDQDCDILTIESDGNDPAILIVEEGAVLTIKEDFIVVDVGDDSEIEIIIEGTIIIGDQFSMETTNSNSGAQWIFEVAETGLLDINGTGTSDCEIEIRQSGALADVTIDGEINTEADFLLQVQNDGSIEINIAKTGKVIADDYYQRVKSSGSTITTNLKGGIISWALEIDSNMDTY